MRYKSVRAWDAVMGSLAVGDSVHSIEDHAGFSPGVLSVLLLSLLRLHCFTVACFFIFSSPACLLLPFAHVVPVFMLTMLPTLWD